MRTSGADGHSDQARQQVSPHGRYLPLVNGSLGRLLPVLKAVHQYDGLLQRLELLLSQKVFPHLWGTVHNLS